MGAWGFLEVPPVKEAKHHTRHQYPLQCDDDKCDEISAGIQKMRAAAEAHCTGSAIAVKRFSSILGIPEPKP